MKRCCTVLWVLALKQMYACQVLQCKVFVSCFFFFFGGGLLYFYFLYSTIFVVVGMYAQKTIQIRVQSKKKKKNLSQRTLNIHGFHSYTLSMPPDSAHRIILMRLSDLEIFQNQGRKQTWPPLLMYVYLVLKFT